VTNTPINGLTYPALTDQPNGPAQLQTLVGQLDTRLIPRFANATARDAAITAPVEGMYADLADTDVLWRYSGTLWVPVTLKGTTAWSASATSGVNVTVTYGFTYPVAPILEYSWSVGSLHRWYSYLNGGPGVSSATVRMQQGENISDTATGSIYWTVRPA
jgi:hypothetical protein